MQLKSMMDLSFLRSKRAFIFKAGLSIVLFAAVTAAFFAVFKICIMLSVFSFSSGLPATVVTVLFTFIQLMSIFSCMTGLSKTLYHGGDNVILLILPVPQNMVFLSKLAVYYVFELKRNLTLTVPLFLAYGLVNGAVVAYYPWMLFCFLFVSLLPVAIGAVLSIPAFYIPKILSRFAVVKYAVILAAAAGVTVGAFYLVGLIPENINLLGQWGSITSSIRRFLDSFAKVFAPWHYLNLMMVGGSLAIARNPITMSGIVAFFVNFGVCMVLIALSFFSARILFLKMTASANDGEIRSKKNRPNRVHSKWTSAFSEDLLRNVRSGKALWRSFIEFFVPAFLLFALNRIYAAMNTSLSGQTMTSAFNILVLLVTVLTANGFLAHVYSRDGAARNILKTRPVDFRVLLVSRLVFRAIMSTLSVIVAVLLYHLISKCSAMQSISFAVMAVALNLAHIFLCGEIDVMHPEGVSENKNSVTATVYAIVIAILFAAGYYLIAESGSALAFLKLAVVAVLLCGLRVFLYFERVRVYFVEK